MLKIRFQRVGRKHEPAMRLVLTESENSTKSGRFKEILGSYDARKNTDQVNKERVSYWLGKGAKATGSVHNFLIAHKVIDAKKVNVLPKKTVAKVEAPVEEAAPVSAPETSPTEEAPAEVPVETTPATEEAAASTETPAEPAA